MAQEPTRLREIVRTVDEAAGCVHLAAMTADHALAVCVAQLVNAAVVDEGMLSVDGWSLAQSLKMVRPTLTTVVISERQPSPQGVDFWVKDLEQLHARLLQLSGSGNSATA